MPVTVLVDIAGANVGRGPEADEHCLNWPLELGQEDVVVGNGKSVGLESVDSNQTKAYTLYIDVVALIPTVPECIQGVSDYFFSETWSLQFLLCPRAICCNHTFVWG